MGKEWDRLWTNHPNGQQGRIDGQGGMDTWNRTPQYKGGLAAQAWHETWAREAFSVLKPGGYLLAAGGTRTFHRLVCALEDAGFEIRDTISHIYGSGFPKSKSMKDIGYPELGTALKPAFEPWTLARKPLSEKNVAQNVLKHGTGAINVDATRVQSSEDTARSRALVKSTSAPFGKGYEMGGNGHSAGRWPPNLLLSHVGGPNGCKPTGEVRRVKSGDGKDWSKEKEHGTGEGATYLTQKSTGQHYGTEPQEVWECVVGCPVREMDRQSGQLTKHKPGKRNADGFNSGVYGQGMGIEKGKPNGEYGDTGGASRFFPCFEGGLEALFRYAAKASRAERNKGLEGMPESGVAQRYGLVAGGNTPQQTPHKHVPQSNNHPTVKPIALMRWLVRLVTPPGGTVLDLFAGSGSTGCAAVQEGFNFIGIEQDSDYALIAEKRISYWANGQGVQPDKPRSPSPPHENGKGGTKVQGSLFDEI